jgi:pyruvate dehydrogenase E2 component (dihydrolipoamide acetyltransferase)
MARIEEVRVPDIGDFEEVDVVEVLIAAGDAVAEGDSLISLESDKATMDVPAPRAGRIREVKVATGDKVSQGHVIVTLELSDQSAAQAESSSESPAPAAAAAEQRREQAPPPSQQVDTMTTVEIRPQTPAPQGQIDERAFRQAYASPAVRQLARELGVDLGKIAGSGSKGRILRQDVQAFVKQSLSKGEEARAGGALPPMPTVDFSKFGDIERRPLSRIRKISGANVFRSWLHVPHVTQFDEADITELEEFRKARSAEAQERGIKLTLLAFIMKACADALERFPEVNSSLDPDGEHLILKRYIHIGFAVDTDDGLLVPVIRDADAKGIFELAQELGTLSASARAGKLRLEQMQGASFTISSLGGIGGTAFTPIVNAPEVAMLGVSRAQSKPVYRDGGFVPRLVLPLSFSYDHRVIDGALGVRFTTYLAAVLSDLRRMLL